MFFLKQKLTTFTSQAITHDVYALWLNLKLNRFLLVLKKWNYFYPPIHTHTYPHFITIWRESYDVHTVYNRKMWEIMWFVTLRIKRSRVYWGRRDKLFLIYVMQVCCRVQSKHLIALFAIKLKLRASFEFHWKNWKISVEIQRKLEAFERYS